MSHPPTPAEAWIHALEHRLWTDFSVRPVLAAEIEFYLHGAEAMEAAPLIQRIDAALATAGIVAHPAQKEVAAGQYEVSLVPMQSGVALAQWLEQSKSAITDWAASARLRASFAAKPFAERAGSGLHLHLHLEDAEEQNLFTREEDYSAPLRHSIAGLLHTLPACMTFFAPSAESYVRFRTQPPSPERPVDAPTHICWGPNNRTTALRLPNKPSNAKHIEHRVPGSDADPALALGALLFGVWQGLQQAQEPPPAIHGQAYKEIYDLARLPETSEAARAYAAQDALLMRDIAEFSLPV